MRSILKTAIDILIAVGVGFLGYACLLFVRYNEPLIQHDFYFIAALSVNLILILIALSRNTKRYSVGLTVFNFFFTITISSFIFYTFLNAIVYHCFQPVYQFDRIIYASIIGFGLLSLILLIQSLYSLSLIARPLIFPKYIWIGLLAGILLLQFYGFNLFKREGEYTHIASEPAVLFDTTDTGYIQFRKPSLLVIHAGETLADSSVLMQDRVLIFAEGVTGETNKQRQSSLIGKYSEDAGKTWQDSSINQEHAQVMCGAGNATTVFDTETGIVFVFYIKEVYDGDYRTYVMKSLDGGITWETDGYVFDGVSGPGHGIQIRSGPYAGRLIVPSYDTASCVLYSDDHGDTWCQGNSAEDGNECELIQIGSGGQLLMIIRPNVNACAKHCKLTKQYAISVDGGVTWSSLKPLSTFKDPICMSSITNYQNMIYYVYPDHYFSRARMTVARSMGCGKTWPDQWLIYNGPSGYSDIGVLSNGEILVLFENGRVAYNERVVLVTLDTE